MNPIILAILILLPLGACKERKPVDDAVEQAETLDSPDTLDQTADVEEQPAAIENPPAPENEAEAAQETTSTPAPAPPPMIMIKPAEKYNEYCSFAKKLEATESIIRLSTENFGFKADPAAVDTLQCLVTLDATIPKGKRLVPVILPQSYYSGLGMLATGQSLQVDINILTLDGDNIEASLEYQAIAMGPIADDTEFVRSMQLMRRISPPCQMAEGAKRKLAVLIVLTLNKGSAALLPPAGTRELPRIDYALESCNVT